MMCSFAKFLALGLIASESHGPVFAEAITKEEYEYVVGVSPDNTDANSAGNDARRAEACREMNKAYKDYNKSDLTNWSSTACTANLYGKYKQQMVTFWGTEATKLGLKSSSWKVDTDPTAKNNVKFELINALTQKLTGLGGAYSLTTGSNYYAQIKDLKKVVEVEEKLVAQSFVPRMKTLKAILLQVEKDVLDAKVKSDAAVLLGNTEIILNSLEQAVRTANENKIKEWQEGLVTWEARANDLTLFVRKEKAAEAEKAETLGGVFGVLAAAVVGAFIFLVSPCVMFNFNDGTVKGDEMWSRDVFYGEKYGKDVNGKEIKGLDGKEIKESETKEGSALTLVPVGVLAVGVLAVARRGLNKRRAQKKAKRASRAQERLHEDL